MSEQERERLLRDGIALLRRQYATAGDFADAARKWVDAAEAALADE